jgi:hypothetical protein
MNNSFLQSADGSVRPLNWLRPVLAMFRREPDAATVNALADDIMRAPLLQAWLLTAAGRPRRTRRELLARAGRAIASEYRDGLLMLVLEQMANPRVHDAVVDELFRRGGLRPLEQRSGRAARARLEQLGECLGAGSMAATA